jgi:hypothetical protein
MECGVGSFDPFITLDTNSERQMSALESLYSCKYGIPLESVLWVYYGTSIASS